MITWRGLVKSRGRRAVRSGGAGDQATILAYAAIAEDQARSFRPKIVKVDRHNRVRRRG